MTPIKVWTCAFTRSEWGPLGPLVRHLQTDDDFIASALPLSSNMSVDTIASRVTEALLKWEPDVVLCPFDRPEMALVAYLAYHMDYPVAQMFAGDIAGGAYDDADRFSISGYADLLLTADKPQAQRLKQAFQWREEIGEMPEIRVVGATHFDEMETIENTIENYDDGYALVLYNPPSKQTVDGIERELGLLMTKIIGHCPSAAVIWFEPNGDIGSELVEKDALRFQKWWSNGCTYHKSARRATFLGYLKNARCIIGNSSCMFYEAVYFGVPTIQVGIRNRYREPISKKMCAPGASWKIAQILKEKYGRR